jgi:hypothetical protein
MIEFDVGGRKIGKTTRMMQWLEEAPEGEVRIMVVHSAHEAQRLAELAESKGYKNVTTSHFVSYHSLSWLRGLHGNIRLGVDNIDLMLHYLFGAPVDRVSATGVDVLRQVEA